MVRVQLSVLLESLAGRSLEHSIGPRPYHTLHDTYLTPHPASHPLHIFCDSLRLYRVAESLEESSGFISISSTGQNGRTESNR
jgi:hypothetical protein